MDVSTSPSVMLVCNGLILSGSGLTLHENLLQRQTMRNMRKRTWFSCSDKTPLEWYAAIVDTSPAALLAKKHGHIPGDTRQCWVASPYHSQLGRDQVRVTSEGLFPWCAEDAIWLCDVLNPLLKEEGMHLLRTGAALLLACCDPMDARPSSFAGVSGKTLPNRHPEGPDGGRLMRLISEIQMRLHNHQPPHRSGQFDIHGLWVWGESVWPANPPGDMPWVATRNLFLQAVVDGKDARMVITEAERMDVLLKQGASFPKKVILAGEGYAALFTKSLLPKRGKMAWIPKSVKAEPELLSVIRANPALYP